MRVIVRSVIILAASLVSVIGVPAAFASSSGAGGESAQSCPSLAVPRITAELNERLLSSLPGNVHPLAKPEYDRGRVSDSLPMEHMILILQRTSDQEKALNARIEQMHDARSPYYHQWLTAESIGDCYGVADSDITKLTQWLQLHGFQIDTVPSGKMTIIFSGTAGQVRNTFKTEIHNLDVKGEAHIANLTEPQVPSALAPVIAGFRSLNNFFPKSLVHPVGPVQRDGKSGRWHALNNPNAGKEVNGKHGVSGLATINDNGTTIWAVAPQDFYTIYNESPLLMGKNPINGAGQTLAVVQDSDVNPQDVTSFRSQFGLPAYPLVPNNTQGGVNFIQGISNYCGDPGIVYGVETEADIDVQWMGATAPAATIDLVSCADTSTTWGGDLSASYIISNLSNSVSAFSVSFGVCESLLPNFGFGSNSFYNSLWQQAVAQGQTPIVAAGDSGDDVCDFNLGYSVGVNGVSVNGLASTPYNIATGGTDFSDSYQTNFAPTSYWNNNDTSPYGSALSYIPEITWNNTCASTVLVDYIRYALGVTYPNGPEGLCNDTTNFGEVFTGLSGGSGGISTVYSLPSWQQNVYGVGLSSNFTSTSNRNMPDVSLFASDGGINGFLVWQHALLFCESDLAPCDFSTPEYALSMAAGGTSFTAPMMGGILGLINQAESRQGQANYTLYALAAQEYGTPSAPNTSTTAPSLYTCEGSNINAISTYHSVFPKCTFYNLNRTSQVGSSSCLGGNNSGCLVDNNDQPCQTGSTNCYTNTNGDSYGLLSNSTSSFENAFPQSAGYNASAGLGSINVANLVNNWNSSQSHTLTVTISGTGTVASTDGFINCPGTCSHSYAANSPVTLNASPGTGETFNGWSGACTGTGSCNLTVKSSVAVTANFVPSSGVTLSVGITGNGAIASADGFINCPGTCSHTYVLNTQVTLSATPAVGISFTGWTSPCSGTAPCTFTVNQNLSVLGSFGVPTVGVGIVPASLVVGSATNQVYVANVCGNDLTCDSGGDGTVSVINGTTLTAQSVAVDNFPYPIAINGNTNTVYTTTCSDLACQNGTISVINGTTLAETSVPAGVDANFVAVNAVTNKIYATNSGCTTYPCNVPGTLTVLDGAKLTTQTVAVGYDPISVSINSATNKIFVVNECGADPTCSSAGTVTVVDGNTLATQTVNVDFAPLYAGINSVTNMIYVSNNGGADGSGDPGTVTVINGSTLATQRVNVQVDPSPVKVNAVTNTIYVGNRCGQDPNCGTSPSASVINGSTLKVANIEICTSTTIPADFIDLDPVTNTVYFPCTGSPTQGTTGMSVTVLDGATNNTNLVPVGDNPNAAAVDAPANKTYIANSGDSYVSVIAGPSAAPVQFVSLPPCRVLDTRPPNGSGPIQGGKSESFVVPGGNGCAGIPMTAAAFSLNVTVVPTKPLGYLTIWPTGEDQPVVSTLNSPDGRVKANAAIVPAGYQGAVSVYVTDTANVIIDIDGYFVPQATGTLQFYPLTPCRVVDTRTGSTQPKGLGPPSFGAGETRPLPVLSSPCLQNLNPPAQAYSFNATVSPQPKGQKLNYLTLWPTGQNQPVVSTLNNPTATVVANGAIVPAGTNGEIDAFTYNSTDLIMDVNGYFGTPGSGGYWLYPAAPCRVYDSRANNGPPFQGERTVNVVNSPCGPPANATGYVLNATVVPVHKLGYLTLWPDGETQPIVSTLNAYDGYVTSNIAIVPNLDGSVDAYVSDLTQLILDTSGYFGPQSQDPPRGAGAVLQSGAQPGQSRSPALNRLPEKMKMRGKGARLVSH